VPMQAIAGMGEIQKQLDGIMHIVELNYKREAEHVKCMHQASKSTALRHLKHLKAQAAAMESLLRTVQTYR
jgi:hypothetical protein